jgi:hypothetical protein
MAEITRSPAQAGVQLTRREPGVNWAPAFAGEQSVVYEVRHG